MNPKHVTQNIAVFSVILVVLLLLLVLSKKLNVPSSLGIIQNLFRLNRFFFYFPGFIPIVGLLFITKGQR